MARPNAPDLSSQHANLTKPQPYSFLPRSSLFEVPFPRLPASSINRIVSSRNVASRSNSRSPTSTASLGVGLDHLVPRLGPEDELSLYSPFSLAATRPVPDYLTKLSFSSPISPSWTSPTFEFPHQPHGQFPALPSWAEDNCPSQPRPENTNGLLEHHHTQLIANSLDHIKGGYNDSTGILGKETKKPHVAKKKELLRKRRNARMDGSGSNLKRRETESGTRASRLDTHMPQGRDGASLASAVKRPDTPDEDIPTDQERSDDTDGDAHGNKTRLKHNRVERRYRQRLNTHYERLLGSLPPPGDSKAPEMESIPHGDEGNSSVGSKQGESQPVPGGSPKEPEASASPNQRRERAVSKAEVLERAKSYIKSLEDEHERLVAERDELLKIWEASRMKCDEVEPV